MKTSLQALYWVASAQDNPGNPAFHIDVLDEAATMKEVAALGGVAQRVRQLNVASALAEGFSLDVIGAAINENTVRELVEAQALIAGEGARTDQAVNLAVEKAVADALDQANAARAEAEALLRQTIDELRYEIAALKEAPPSSETAASAA